MIVIYGGYWWVWWGLELLYILTPRQQSCELSSHYWADGAWFSLFNSSDMLQMKTINNDWMMTRICLKILLIRLSMRW